MGGGPMAEMQARFNVEWQTPASIEFDAAAGETYSILGRWSEPMYAVTVVRASDDAASSRFRYTAGSVISF